jgi:hypothetical protein
MWDCKGNGIISSFVKSSGIIVQMNSNMSNKRWCTIGACEGWSFNKYHEVKERSNHGRAEVQSLYCYNSDTNVVESGIEIYKNSHQLQVLLKFKCSIVATTMFSRPSPSVSLYKSR